MTAEEFEAGLYAVLGKDLDPGFMEEFKAKGDEAYVFVDLCSIANIDPEDYESELLDFMYEAGVPEFPGLNRSKGFEIWPDRQVKFRDFTIGELKQVFANKTWKEDTYTFKKMSFFDNIMRLTLYPIAIVTAIIIGVLVLIIVLIYRRFAWIWRQMLHR